MYLLRDSYHLAGAYLEQLLTEAKRQIAENGYSATTFRSVAGACGLGIGTVYNYFKSKDMLIASFMLEDWRKCLEAMHSGIRTSVDPHTVLRCIYKELQGFLGAHRALFSDSDATKVFSTVFSDRHRQLRSQLAALLRPLCDRSPVENKDFLAEFVAESLLTWTVAGKPFADIFSILSALLK